MAVAGGELWQPATVVVVGHLLAIYCVPLGSATTYEFLDALLTELEKA